MRVLVKVLKYSAKPPTIFYPIPLLPALIVFFADGNLLDLLKVIFVTFLFYSALNLWNHVNDWKEDFKAGKDTPFVSERVRKATTFYVFLAYLLSLALFSILSSSFAGKVFFWIVLLLTFLYSDNMITKLRLKRHYTTELLTYFLCTPLFILSLHDLVKPVDFSALALSLTLLPSVVSTVFIKDLKDISEDREAGWMTLGVVFEAETLVKIFFYLNVLFYILFTVFLFSFSKISPIFSLAFVSIPLYYVIKNRKRGWIIDLYLAKGVQNTIYSGFTFVLIFTILFYFE